MSFGEMRTAIRTMRALVSTLRQRRPQGDVLVDAETFCAVEWAMGHVKACVPVDWDNLDGPWVWTRLNQRFTDPLDVRPNLFVKGHKVVCRPVEPSASAPSGVCVRTDVG